MHVRPAAILILLSTTLAAQEARQPRLELDQTLTIDLGPKSADPEWLDVDPDGDPATPNHALRYAIAPAEAGSYTIEMLATVGNAWLRIRDESGEVLATSEQHHEPRSALTVELAADQVAIVEVVSTRLATMAALTYVSGPASVLDGPELFRTWIEDAQRRVDARIAEFGASHPDTIHALNHLGYLQYSTGEFLASLGTYLRAVDAADELGDPFLRAFTRNQVAASLRQLGDHAQAASIYGTVLEIAADSARHDELAADSLQGLSAIAKAKGDFEAALEQDRRVLDLYRNAEEPEPKHIGIAWNNLGMSLAALERRDEAADAFQRAASILTATPGGALHCATPFAELAVHRFFQGEFALAAGCARYAILMIEGGRGREHPSYTRHALRVLPVLARSGVTDGATLAAARAAAGFLATRPPRDLLLVARRTVARLDPAAEADQLAALESALDALSSRDEVATWLLGMAATTTDGDARLGYLRRVVESTSDDPSCSVQNLVARARIAVETAARAGRPADHLGAALDSLEPELAAAPDSVTAAILGRFADALDTHGDPGRAEAIRARATATALRLLRTRIPGGMRADFRWAWIGAVRGWIDPTDSASWAEYVALRHTGETGALRVPAPPTADAVRAVLPPDGAFVDVIEARGTTSFRVIRANGSDPRDFQDRDALERELRDVPWIAFTWRGPFARRPLSIGARCVAVADGVHLVRAGRRPSPPPVESLPLTELTDPATGLGNARAALAAAQRLRVDLPRISEDPRAVRLLDLWRHTEPLGWLFDDSGISVEVETGLEAGFLLDDGGTRWSAADLMRTDLSACQDVAFHAEADDPRTAALVRAFLRAGARRVRVIDDRNGRTVDAGF